MCLKNDGIKCLNYIKYKKHRQQVLARAKKKYLTNPRDHINEINLYKTYNKIGRHPEIKNEANAKEKKKSD